MLTIHVFPILHSDYTEPGDPGYGNDTPWRWLAIVSCGSWYFRVRRALTRRSAERWVRTVLLRELPPC